MKELIPRDEYGVFADTHDTARVDSLYVAKMFEKEHRSVLRDIRNLDCSEEFRLHNFVQSSYNNEQGKRQPCYYMTRDGFVFLVMGYRGKKAARFKELYIRRFNEMEQLVQELVKTRKEFPLLTENIKLLHLLTLLARQYQRKYRKRKTLLSYSSSSRIHSACSASPVSAVSR